MILTPKYIEQSKNYLLLYQLYESSRRGKLKFNKKFLKMTGKMKKIFFIKRLGLNSYFLSTVIKHLGTSVSELRIKSTL